MKKVLLAAGAASIVLGGCTIPFLNIKIGEKGNSDQTTPPQEQTG
ncbi:MAG: hypothetical protein ACD_40C00110G0001, partial [uncultured bacterium]